MAFDTPQHYRAWETSTERHRWARQLPELLAGSTESRRLTGLAAWVVDPAQPLSGPPPRWKTAVATWLGIFPHSRNLGCAHSPDGPALPVPPSWPSARGLR